jgi:predicted dehydrogenase
LTKKIAVIGFGFMGVVHAKNIIASNNLELCAIVDNRSGDIFSGIESIGNVGPLDLPIEELKLTPVFKTLKECVNHTTPDAVAICVPYFLHYELTKQALDLGLNVLLEKPFCVEVDQGQELIKLADEKMLILMVAHCIRFAPEWEFLAACIHDKRFGQLQLLSTTRSAGEPTWGVWKKNAIKKTCGGSLFDLLIHDIDFMNYCLGKPTDIKINLSHNEYWELSLDYTGISAHVSVNGGFLYKHTTFASEYVATFELSSIRYSSLQPGTIHIGTDSGAETKHVSGDSYRNELEYFGECIQSRNKPEKCLPEASLQTIETCKRIEELNEFISV